MPNKRLLRTRGKDARRRAAALALLTELIFEEALRRREPMLVPAAHHRTWNDHDYWALSNAGKPPYVFYAPTLRTALLVNEAAYRQVIHGDLPPMIARKLRARSSCGAQPVIAPPNAFHLGVGLTRDCTLACVYCHAEADIPVGSNWAVVHAAIRFAFEKAAKTPRETLSVSFAVGGEPTMNWPLFTKSVAEIRRLEADGTLGVKRVFLSMTTNAFYGPSKRAFIVQNFDHLTVSVDGPPNVHNAHRPSRSGRGTYEMVAESVKYFLSHPKVRTGLRSTVSSQSVSELPGIVRHFRQEFGPGITVAFEPLAPLGRAVRQSLIRPPDLNEFAERYIEARALGATMEVRVTCSAPSVSRLIARYCGAMSLPSFAVCVGGQVTACHRDQEACDYGYGGVDPDTGAVSLDPSRLQKISQLAECPSHCAACFLKWHCAGDCPDLRRIGWSRCDFNRAVAFDQIINLFAREKGGDGNG